MVVIAYLKSLSTHRCGFESHHALRILSSEKTIQLANATPVVLLKSPSMPENLQKGTAEVFPHQ
jgi:hypothetical protein